MKKTILITGATDGIGLATAISLTKLGHQVLVHGRSEDKLLNVQQQLSEFASPEQVSLYQADLSITKDVHKLAEDIKSNHQKLDGVINNAGVYIVTEKTTKEGLDVRFMVNTIAPYLLTKQLLPLLDSTSRVINLSSAAQAPVSPDELTKPSSFAKLNNPLDLTEASIIP